jgi:hypothetical protein
LNKWRFYYFCKCKSKFFYLWVIFFKFDSVWELRWTIFKTLSKKTHLKSNSIWYLFFSRRTIGWEREVQEHQRRVGPNPQRIARLLNSNNHVNITSLSLFLLLLFEYLLLLLIKLFIIVILAITNIILASTLKNIHTKHRKKTEFRNLSFILFYIYIKRGNNVFFFFEKRKITKI